MRILPYTPREISYLETWWSLSPEPFPEFQGLAAKLRGSAGSSIGTLHWADWAPSDVAVLVW